MELSQIRNVQTSKSQERTTVDQSRIALPEDRDGRYVVGYLRAPPELLERYQHKPSSQAEWQREDHAEAASKATDKEDAGWPFRLDHGSRPGLPLTVLCLTRHPPP